MTDRRFAFRSAGLNTAHPVATPGHKTDAPEQPINPSLHSAAHTGPREKCSFIQVSYMASSVPGGLRESASSIFAGRSLIIGLHPCDDAQDSHRKGLVL